MDLSTLYFEKALLHNLEMSLPGTVRTGFGTNVTSDEFPLINPQRSIIGCFSRLCESGQGHVVRIQMILKIPTTMRPIESLHTISLSDVKSVFQAFRPGGKRRNGVF